MKYLSKVVCTIGLAMTVIGCSDASANSSRTTPLYITPMIEGVTFSKEALSRISEFESVNESIRWSRENGYNGATLLSETLDKLEPGGPSGNVQVGYEMGISLLNLYKKENNEWKIDKTRLKQYLDLIENVDRPVVVYLMANHFDAKGDLVTELEKDNNNLMLLNDGKPPIDNYFGNSIMPFTLLTDENIPVNYYRFNALRDVAEEIMKLPQEAKDRIIGITMAGEVHQLFPDFTNGTGEYDNMRVTDYSPNSVKDFQRWLEEKYVTIEELNSAIESDFKDFESIEPPSKNIHTQTLNAFTEHYDAYADGIVSISGWLWDPNSVIKELTLYVDGVEVGEVQRGLHRLDVYRAVEEINTPNVGYRYDLDYTKLTPGKHNVQVVAKIKKKLYLMDQSEIVIVDRNQGEAAPAPENNMVLENIEEIEEIRHWMDYPRPLTPLYYNPLAVEWNEYRGYQVKAFIDYFADILKEAGISSDILFTHQIYSKINSAWNPTLFMEESSVDKGISYQLGINLYGGATNSDAVRAFLKERQTTLYGVPEYHIQQWKDPNVAMESLKAQYRNGAKFISPYYISMIPDSLRHKEKSTLQDLTISPTNDSEGSSQLYEAIVEYAKQ